MLIPQVGRPLPKPSSSRESKPRDLQHRMATNWALAKGTAEPCPHLRQWQKTTKEQRSGIYSLRWKAGASPPSGSSWGGLKFLLLSRTCPKQGEEGAEPSTLLPSSRYFMDTERHRTETLRLEKRPPGEGQTSSGGYVGAS